MDLKKISIPLAYTLACATLVGGTAVAMATDVPDLDLSWYETAATEPVSVFTVPDGQGNGFDAAFAYGGMTMDATITLHLVDSQGIPFVGYPADDLWLETTLDGLALCASGSIADEDTNADGVTWWQEPLAAGGHSDPGVELTIVIVSGSAMPQPGLEIYFNSPDLSGDTVVILTDVAMITQNIFGPYSYRADYYWDGVINLSDVAYMTTLGLGAGCP